MTTSFPTVDREFLNRARAAGNVAALTGAGVSAASGIPTFRGADGYWRGNDPMTLASPQGFAADPVLVWEWYAMRRELIDAAAPNGAHVALAELERRLGAGRFTLITQNVDGLHRRAGSSQMLELHGNLTRASCWAGCGRVWDWQLPLEPLPPRCACGGLARPDVVWFGEMLDAEVIGDAHRAAAAAGLLLVVGTSSLVEPAASLPLVTRSRGGLVVEINPEATPLSALADLRLAGPADTMLPPLVAALCDDDGGA
ncbi:MAG: NAD-dependent deacylase [Candidatus Eiseniibacteriota bacterium]|jgi:NAD-dependent deacetylase